MCPLPSAVFCRLSFFGPERDNEISKLNNRAYPRKTCFTRTFTASVTKPLRKYSEGNKGFTSRRVEFFNDNYFMKGFLFSFLLLSCFRSHSQLSLYDSVNVRHNKISSAAITTLAGWSAASMASGLIGQNNSEGDVRQFHKRNVLFGGINLAFSGLALLRTHYEAARGYTPAETFKRTASTQKVLLFNAGLDLAYLAYGLYTRERAFRYTGDKRDRLRGTGNSLLVQSGFLTVLDFVQYFLQSSNAKRLNKKLGLLSFAPTGNGFGLVYRF